MLWSLAGAFAFVAAIALLDNRLAHFVIGPDRPGMWYEWQLAAPGWASRASAWTGYALHQIAFWALIWKAQHSNLKWTDHAKPINFVAFGVTVAVVAGDGNWQMFAFGLAGVFVVTQAWGLGFRRRTCLAIAAAYALVVLAWYSQWDWSELPRVFRILGGYYVALPLMAALVVGLARLVRLVRSQRD